LCGGAQNSTDSIPQTYPELYTIFSYYGKFRIGFFVLLNFVYNFPFLKTLKANLSDSIPIAEYCVVYERKEFCNIHDDIDASETNDIADVYLRFQKVLQKQPKIIICETMDKDAEDDFNWINKFLIHDSLKAEKIGCEFHFSEKVSREDFLLGKIRLFN
jgi:hypothetical protein